MIHVHTEIEYRTENEELGEHTVHSDVCPPNCSLENITEDYRKFLHGVLDEWLNNSGGTGIFYITGEPEKYFSPEEEKEK